MKIKLTSEKFRTLVKMLYWGDWMINGYKSEIDELGQEIESLEQSIYALAKDYGEEEWIAYDEESKLYYPTTVMREALDGKIAEYEEYVLQREKFN